MAITEKTLSQLSEELFDRSLSPAEAAKLAVNFKLLRQKLSKGEALVELDIEPASLFGFLEESRKK